MNKPASSLTIARRLPRLAISAGLMTAFSVSFVSGQEDSENKEPEKPRGAFPTLNILPEGSILRRIRLPRYDKDFNPISLLEAERLTVLDKNRIEAEGVNVELYGKNGEVQVSTKMRRAIYYQKDQQDRTKSTLHAEEAVYVKGSSYIASGSGLIFHWETRQGFLHGPASTRFYFQKENTKDTAMKTRLPTQWHNNRLKTYALAGSLATLSTSILAEPPAPLTQKQLAELDHAAQPMASHATTERKATQQTIHSETTLNESARDRMSPFLKNIGQAPLLAQAPTAPQKPEQTSPTPTPAEGDTKDTDKNTTTLLVECDGGLYFDNDSGILAYLKNIRLTESRFKLKCDNELKVFLAQKPEKENEAEKTEPNNDQTTPQPETDEKEKSTDKSLSSFGEVSKIIASGNVQVTRNDDKGKPFIATAEIASYDAKTEEIILRGGMPRLQQTKNQYLQAQEPGQWIRVLKSGKLVTSSGKWKMFVVRNKPIKRTP